MNARTVSLPDLVTEKRRNTALSLTEGFAGARREGSLAATAQNWCPRPGAGAPMPGQKEAGKELEKVLPTYYRTRQLALSTEKSGHRMPQKLCSELRFLEKAVAREIRVVHPLFFQRFDDPQLDRFLRSMPFLRLSAGRWLFGGESLGATWPEVNGDRVFILLQGKLALYSDPAGIGERRDVEVGAIIGETRFLLGDESMRDSVAGAAHCEEPCIAGLITTHSIEAAFADRVFGNARIAQTIRNVPSMSRICKPDEALPASPGGTMAGSPKARPEDESSSAVITALRELSKTATAVHLASGTELLSSEPLEESVTVVCKGALEIRGDITLAEKLDVLPPKKVRMRVHIKKGENLAGGSIFDTLDPYIVVKINMKKFQTPVMWNAGNNPKFDYHGVLTYDHVKDVKEDVVFTIMDRDQFSADDFCGSGTIPSSELYDGWTGWICLTKPKPGLMLTDGNLEQEAGKIQVTINWDFEKINPLTRKPNVKSWPNQELFILKEQECWGHEHIMLQSIFMRTLEQASNALAYNVSLTNIRVMGHSTSGGDSTVSCWKSSKHRFMDFVKHSGREKPFLQACRVSALEKQTQIKELAKRLIRQWEIEKETEALRKSMLGAPPPDDSLDPSRFRVAYRGYKAQVYVRYALNLSGGGLFDKLDPYAVLRFKGSKHTFHTGVKQDAGADPIWDDDGPLQYNGETTLEISVWDYDKYSANDLLATGTLNVEEFCRGFEGSVNLTKPRGGDKKKKTMKQMMIVVGVQWPPLEMNAALALGNTSASALTNVGGGGMMESKMRITVG